MDNEALREALEIGLDAARELASDYHLKYKGYRREGHEAVDEDVRKIEAAIASLPVVKKSLTTDCKDGSQCGAGGYCEDCPHRAETPALSDREIERGWIETFSTDNPFCPCNLKSFTKAAQWAERALLAKTKP